MYFYHGYGIGVASTMPGREFTEAMCALSVRGGTASATTKKFSTAGKFGCPGLIDVSFDCAQSDVSGSEDLVNGIPIWTTAASVIVENLTITGKVNGQDQEILYVGHLEAHIISQFRTGDYEATMCITKGKARSGLENVRILKKPVEAHAAPDMFQRYVTWNSMVADFGNAFTKDRLMACLMGRGLPADDQCWHKHATHESYNEQDKLPSLKQAVVCSFVKEVRGAGIDNKEILAWGPVIDIPDCGTLYLGEVIAWPWMRCLTMFRIELTSGGTISGGSAGANGTTYPPGAHPSTSGSGA